MPTLSTIYTSKPAVQDARAVTLTHTTAAIANQASEDYNFVISNMSQLLKVSCDVDCRVILYGSSAGRAADTRVYNDYNNDNSIVNSTNLLFDVVLTAGTQNVNNVFLTNREGSNRSTIYAKIFNLSGASSAVEVGLKVVQFGFENDFNLITTQTANCTANDGESIPCDTSNGAFTITTPASGRFKVIDVAGNASTEGFGVNNLTIEAAAGTTIMGDAVLNLDVGAISPEFQLIGTDWRITNSNYGGVVDSAPPVVTREVLTANRTYYVRTDGNDNNEGLSDTAGGAFATIQKAIDVAGGLDWSIYNVSIVLGTGVYVQTQPIVLKRGLGDGTLTIQGSTATATDCILRGTNVQIMQCYNLSNIFLKNLQIDEIDATTSYTRGLDIVNSSVDLDNVAFSGTNSAIGCNSENSFVTARGLILSGVFYVGLIFSLNSSFRYTDGTAFTETATFGYVCLQFESSRCRFFDITITGVVNVALTLYSWLVQKTGKTVTQTVVTDSLVKTF